MIGGFGMGPQPGRLWKQWPKLENGEPVPPALLTTCGGADLEENLLVNMLEAYGIPALVRYPGDGAFGKIVLGVSGTGCSIFVPETMLEEAKDLMEEDNNGELQSGV